MAGRRLELPDSSTTDLGLQGVGLSPSALESALLFSIVLLSSEDGRAMELERLSYTVRLNRELRRE